MKRDELLIYETTWVNPKLVMLSEISQAQKKAGGGGGRDILHNSIYIKC